MDRREYRAITLPRSTELFRRQEIMNSVQTEGRWLEVQKRIKVIRRGEQGVRRVELTNWYGRLKVNGHWKWFKLFTD